MLVGITVKFKDVVYDGLDTMTEGSMSETPNNSFELSSSTPKSSGLFHATRPSYNTYQQWDQKDPLTRPFLMPPPTHPPVSEMTNKCVC